jgi:hypothetical protein
MKLKVFTFILLSLFLNQTSFSQTTVLKDVEFNLSVDKLEWTKEDNIVVKLSGKNNSDKNIKLELSPSFGSVLIVCGFNVETTKHHENSRKKLTNS